MAAAALVGLGVLVAGCGPALTALGVITFTARGESDRPVDTPPAVSVTTPAGNVNDIVAIAYRLSDPDPGDRASITVAYSVDGGDFFTATEAFADGAEGTQNLTTSPTGADHLFLWNSTVDLGRLDPLEGRKNQLDVRFRVTATDASAPPGGGTSATTSAFAVLNAYMTTLARAPIPPGTSPSGLAIDPLTGDLIVGDGGGSRVLRVDRDTGATSVAAGTGESGYNGQNIAGPTAQLNRPIAVAVAPDGDLLVADVANGLLRRIDRTSGFISDVLGDGTTLGDDYAAKGVLSTDVAIFPRDVALDAAGNPFLLAFDFGRVRALNVQAPQDLTVPSDGVGGLVAIGPGRVGTVYSTTPSLTGTFPTDAFDAPKIEGAVAVAIRNGLLYVLEVGQPGAATQGPRLIVANLNTTGGPAVFMVPAPPPGPALPPVSVSVGLGRADVLVDDVRLPKISGFADLALLADQVLLLASGGDGALYGLNLSASAVTVSGTTLAPGEVRVVVGASNEPDLFGDGEDPLTARLIGPFGVAVEGDTIFLSETDGRVRVIAPPGQDVTVGALTVSGGTVGTVGVILPGTKAAVSSPLGPSIAANGDLLLGDADAADPRSNRVLRVSATDATVTGLAGTGVVGDIGDGGPAVDARTGPTFVVAEDPARGLVLFAEFVHHRVRAVNVGAAPVTYLGVTIAPGEIDTVVGTGERSVDSQDVGDGGPATQARLRNPSVAQVDRGGLLWVSDSGNDRLRVCNTTATPVVVLGVTIAPGEVETVVGTGDPGDPADDGDGGPAGSARLDSPGALLGPDGNVWLLDGLTIANGPTSADEGEARLRVVNLQGAALTLGGVTIAPGEIETVIGKGELRLDDDSNLGDGGPALDATFRTPSGISPRADGLVFISDAEDNRVRVANLSAATITVRGVPLPPARIETIVGTGIAGYSGDPSSLSGTFAGGAPAGLVDTPQGPVALADGRLFFSDGGNGALRMANLAEAPRRFAGIEALPGEVVVIAGSRSGRVRPKTPVCVVVDPSDVVLFTDLGEFDLEPAVLQIDPVTRVVTRAAGTLRRTRFDRSDLGDGGPALLATLAEAIGLSLDPQGSLLVADGGNRRIRWVNRTATAQTVGAVTIDPGNIGSVVDGSTNDAVADDADGDALTAPTALTLFFPTSVAVAGRIVWVADEGTDRVLRLDTSGTGTVQGIWPVPGRPTALAAVDDDEVFVAFTDDAVGAARVVLLQGVATGAFSTTNVAGTGQGDWNGDALDPLLMNLSEIRGLARDGSVLLLTDRNNHRVVAVNRGAATTYAGVALGAGVARMIAGAGQGEAGFNGDAIPPASALLNQPNGVAATPLGGVVVVDTANQRVRRFQR